MKPMKEYLISISLCAALLIVGGCSNENDMANSGNGNPIPLTVRATAGSFEEVPETGKSDAPSTRTPTEDGNTTTFATGDAIGIFAIKDGAIVDGISNSKLTYSDGADGAAGSWNPEEGIALYWYEGVSYIAYYPYTDGIMIDATKTTDEIIASLDKNGKLQPAADQSAADGSTYTASDLMTASATSADITTNVSGERFLSLKFTHQFSLLVLVPRISEYIAPAGATYTYWGTTADNHADNVTLNSITPYRMADGSFRAIVPPTTTASTLHGNYKDEADRMVNFRSTPYSSGFTGGGCYTLTVTRSQPGVTPERKVAVGDFYMQNGMIVAGDKETLTAEEKANCIGIVFKVDTGSGDNVSYYDGKLTAIQGYVVSLGEAGRTWGDASKQWTDVLHDYRGYLNTKKVLEGINQGYSFPGFQWCIDYAPKPTGVTSGWYFPSSDQVGSFVNNKANLNTYLNKTGSTQISQDVYATSSESRDGPVLWCISRTPGEDSGRRGDKSRSRKTRAALTF